MTHRSTLFLPVAFLAMCLAVVVVVLGAYTRITNAGLGCPDWPGCYGELAAPESISSEVESHYGRPFDRTKARTEMIHRYAAGTLGILVLALAAMAWSGGGDRRRPVKLTSFLLAVVVVQAMLGMWTVTWLLKPAIVTAHLMGGLTTLALLFWLVLRQFFQAPPGPTADPGLWPWAVAALVVLAVQIFLGGWTSANYAALACPEFPACRAGAYWPQPDFNEGFVFWRGVGTDYEGGVLDLAARTAVHLAHRVGALAAFLVIGLAAIRALLSSDARARVIGVVLALLLVLQVSLGIGNVLLALPVALAVAHNATAALLLLALTALLHRSLVSRR